MPKTQTQPVSTTGQEPFERDCLVYFTALFRYVRAGVGSDEDAEDLTQDVFALAFSRQDQFTGGDLDAWLYRIARNRVAMFYRRKNLEKKGRAVLVLGPTADDQVSEELDQGPAREELQGAAYRAMAELEPLEREAIRLKFAQAFENVQIAKFLNVSPGHLGVILHRALKKMRRQLEAWGHE